MKPLKIEFQAFGPYAGYESVDFESLSQNGLFLICGKTGIGKTMILDAMTFALYGKSSGHGRDDFESMRCTNADFNTMTFVRFEFENNGEYYLFERRLERKRKNLSPSYNLAVKTDDGIWQPLMENPREKMLTDKAAEIIGLEYDQFRQVIVLPQGQFERLLTAGSDEKEKILTSIFGEDKWQIIAEHFYEEAENRKNELKMAREAIKSSLGEDGCGSIEELEKVILQRRGEEKALDEEFAEAEYEKLIKDRQKILTVAKRFSDLHKADDRVAELEGLKDERVVWEQRLSGARRAQKVGVLMKQKQEAALALDRRRKAEEEAIREAGKKEKAAIDASKSTAEHLKKEASMDLLRIKKVQYEEKRGAYEGLGKAAGALEESRKHLEKVQSDEVTAGRKCDRIAQMIAKAQKDFKDLQTQHETLLNDYLAGITGELAAGLSDGMPCPVCGSTLHPKKAKAAANSITKADIDAKKKLADARYMELSDLMSARDEAEEAQKRLKDEVRKAESSVETLSIQLEDRKKNLVPGIDDAAMLEREIKRIEAETEGYERIKNELASAETMAKDEYTAARAKIAPAKEETMAALLVYEKAEGEFETGLLENGFDSEKEVNEMMMSQDEIDELAAGIADHDAAVKTAGENLAALRLELEGLEEPDEVKCRQEIDAASSAVVRYREKKAVLSGEIKRLVGKADSIRERGEGLEGKIRQAEEDFAFAKKLRGDAGTGLRRYVLGIMFSSVVSAANKMLEKVHGGRYRLYRSDDRARGTNKRGLELKVFDNLSTEHDGRFVSTLSGGEKFLAALALSIGISTVAQRNGIRIEALFIDEGFGSLDEESIADAMDVLGSIQRANGMVGIISHVQILQDQIPCKLRVEQDASGSHIVQTVG